MNTAMDRLTEQFDGEVNQLAHSVPIDATQRRVVRPSPDLAYSVCVFDLSDIDHLRLSMPNSDDYLSLALYDNDTNNFFHLNDTQVSSESVEVYLYGPNRGTNNEDGHYVLESPTDKGLVLFRAVLRSADDWARIEAQREKLGCTAVTTG